MRAVFCHLVTLPPCHLVTFRAAPQLADEGGQALPLDELHGVVVDPEVRADRVYRDDVLVAQVGGGQGLALEALQPAVVDGRGALATSYPANPNGSPGGVAALTSPDGRITVLMPHPERVFRTAQMSWHPPEWGEDSPWMRMFRNARVWVG